MNFKNFKFLVIYFFLIYFGIYFLPYLTTPRPHIFIYETLITFIVSASTFFAVYKISFNKNISKNIVSYVQTFAVIILVVFLFFNPLNKLLGSNFLYAITFNGYFSTVVIALYLVLTFYVAILAKLSDYSATIILIPYLLQAIITYILNMGSIYSSFPFLNIVIILVLYIIYSNYLKKK